MILLIVILAAFLRLYRIEPNLVFHGELGDNYLAIKSIVESGQIPLLGPPTSHPWLSFGPLYYYLMAPVMSFANFNPTAGSYFFALSQIALIVINFLVIGKLFGRRVGMVSSALFAVSPLFVNLARQSRFYSLVTVLFYPFFYFLVSGNLFLAGLMFGAMINFHLTPIIFIPPVAIYLLRKKTNIRSYLVFLAGLIIPNIPFVIYNVSNGFAMIKNFSLWIPYRVAGFVGVVPKNSPTWVTILNNFYSLFGVISNSFFYRPLFGTIFIVFVLGFVFWMFKKNWNTKNISSEFLLVLLFVFGYAAIFIHGNPPIHYYLPLYVFPIIFFSLIVTKIKSDKIIVPIIFLIYVLNFRFFFSERWFYQDTSKIYPNKEVPYALQLMAADEILKDSGGNSFSMKRVGEYDYFDQNYSQNYKYLLTWKGGNLKDNSNIVYTIYELKIPEENTLKIFDEGGVIVTKSK